MGMQMRERRARRRRNDDGRGRVLNQGGHKAAAVGVGDNGPAYGELVCEFHEQVLVS
jgi:hypothetical protein